MSGSDSILLEGPSLRGRVGFVLGPALFFLFLLVPLEEGRPEISRMAAVAALMAVWWMSEAIPIPATALLPLVLFPFLGIMPGKAVANEYMKHYIFLFLGGFIIALALKRWNLHRRIALRIVWAIGSEPRTLVLGFMAATGCLSMWISNTATTMMMMPIGLSIIALMEEQALAGASLHEDSVESRRFLQRFPLALMLGIAYGASIGGVGTLIGTPPNVIFAKVFGEQFPGAPEISFKDWFIMAAPFCLVFMLVAWAVLVYVVFPLGRNRLFSGTDVIRREIRSLGRMSRAEISLSLVFALTALMWIFRKDIAFGPGLTLPGWTTLLSQWVYGTGEGAISLSDLVDDGTVAMIGALLLFLIPSGRGRGERLMNWETARELPWGILLLFGGGFALAAGFLESGLSGWIGGQLKEFAGSPASVLVLTISSSITLLTELTSNTATTTMILPVLAGMAKEIQVNPLLLMIPATISASCAFMLPVATPVNAIIFGSGRVPITQMMKAGIILNIIGVLLTLLLIFTLALPIFQIDPGFYPEAWEILP